MVAPQRTVPRYSMMRTVPSLRLGAVDSFPMNPQRRSRAEGMFPRNPHLMKVIPQRCVISKPSEAD